MLHRPLLLEVTTVRRNGVVVAIKSARASSRTREVKVVKEARIRVEITRDSQLLRARRLRDGSVRWKSRSRCRSLKRLSSIDLSI